MRRILILSLVVSACLSAAALGSGGQLKLDMNEAGLEEGVIRLITSNRDPLKLPLKDPKIVVMKSKRLLELYSGGAVIRTYRIGLGLNPVDDKERQGDRRTPEGDFYIFTKNHKSAFYLSLGISYPNLEDAERGLRTRLISRGQYVAIVRANNRRIAPPQNTRLGGDIYIHGNGASSDWTWGCVALENGDIKELFDAVPVGTPVTIRP